MSEATERYAAALFGAAQGDAGAVRAAADALMADYPALECAAE